MNSTINFNRSYRQETVFDKISAFFAAAICLALTFTDGVLDFVSSPVVSLLIKGSAVVVTILVVVGAAGGVDSGSLSFASAAIRVIGAFAVTFLLFKGIEE